MSLLANSSSCHGHEEIDWSTVAFDETSSFENIELRNGIQKVQRQLAALQNESNETQKTLQDSLCKTEREVERLRSLLEDHENSHTSQDPKTEYDVIVPFTSISEFISDRRLDILQAAQSAFKIAEKQRYRIIAVVGLFDKGKTFMINRLFGKNLPSGKLFTTKGLSFLWVQKQRMLVLDSAGMQATVSMRKTKVQPILDAQTTESLLFEMISRIADSVVFVVNDFTWFEQKYISMLHQKYVQREQSNQLIVFHNLRSTGSIEEAEELFSAQITSCYEGEESHLGKLIYHTDPGKDDKGRDKPAIHHIGVCDEFSEAGNHFNDTNFALLMKRLELGKMSGDWNVLPERLSKEFSDLLTKFVNVEVNGVPSQAFAAEKCKVNYIEQSPSQPGSTDSGNCQANGALELETVAGGSLTLKTKGVINSFGEMVDFKTEFEPTVNIYDTCQDGPDGSFRYIQIEAPGVGIEDIDLGLMPNGVKITMEKPMTIDERQVQQALELYPIMQQSGKWEKEFMFDMAHGYFTFEEDDQEEPLKDGIVTIVLRRKQEMKKMGLGSSHPKTPAGNHTQPRSDSSALSDDHSDASSTYSVLM